MAEATIRDVARLAEVSVASVSRALNGLSNVRPEMREKVAAAAAELGYVPHAGARSLSLARAHVIGVVMPDLHGEFFSEFVRGMDRAASQHGYQLLLSNMHDDGDQAVETLRTMRGRADGLLVMAPHIDPATLRTALSPGLPAVLIECARAIDDRPALRFDNKAGVDAIVRHLVDNGFRRIVHISGPEKNLDAQERAEAYRAALAKYAPDSTPAIIPGDFSEEAGEAAAATIIAEGIPYDAVFAGSDMMAVGCIQALKAAGYDVPRDIAVAGFDDIPLARYFELTTMRLSIAEMGGDAVDRLIDLLEGRDVPAGVELHTPELVVRATTAPRH